MSHLRKGVYNENEQTLYIQRDPHFFIEIVSLLPPLPMTHNCTSFPEKSQSEGLFNFDKAEEYEEVSIGSIEMKCE